MFEQGNDIIHRVLFLQYRKDKIGPKMPSSPPYLCMVAINSIGFIYFHAQG
jgi:hypothetical protein